MNNLLTDNAEALKLFFTEDIYLVNDATGAVQLHREAPQPKEEKQPVSFNFLGKNAKKILLLVNDAQHEVSTPEGRETLRNIVKAINLKTDDFALVNYALYKGVAFADLYAFFGCKTALVFGVNAESLGLPDAAENELSVFGETQFIFALNLALLSGDIAAKKMLWSCLKMIQL